MSCKDCWYRSWYIFATLFLCNLSLVFHHIHSTIFSHVFVHIIYSSRDYSWCTMLHTCLSYCKWCHIGLSYSCFFWLCMAVNLWRTTRIILVVPFCNHENTVIIIVYGLIMYISGNIHTCANIANKYLVGSNMLTMMVAIMSPISRKVLFRFGTIIHMWLIKLLIFCMESVYDGVCDSVWCILCYEDSFDWCKFQLLM